MVEQLIEWKVNILFVVGGDGTQRGGRDLGRRLCGAVTSWRWSGSRKRSTTTWPTWTRVSATRRPVPPPWRRSPRHIPRREARGMEWASSS